jgi:23S rRNA (pseudouridine1915-N3)-methyltransferase
VRVVIASVGRWHAGPERALYEHFAERFAPLGKGLGFGALELTEVRDAARLGTVAPKGSCAIALDRQGNALTSEAFADAVSRIRAERFPALVFLIGGPSGLPRALVSKARLVLSLGARTYPHLLVRGLLAEQLYRAATILLNHPYHRGSR